MYLVSAIVLGLMGSFHCVGMCGPIAIALPLNNTNWFTRIIGSLLYNLGRALTYAVMGAVFGVLGEGLQLGGFQRWISVVMGSIMILAVLFPALFKGSKKLDKYLYGYNARLKKRFGLLFNKASYSSLLIIGLLNGLLPCGLVYMALAGAIATGGVSSGALFMFVFGLGTLPMLLLLSLIGNVVSGSIKSRINKMIPYVIVIIGTLFILRGMNLGIKYISPPKNRLHPNDKPMKMDKKMNKGDAKEMTTLYLFEMQNGD